MFESLLDILYPRPCGACPQVLNAGEEVICFDCLLDMPYTRDANRRHNATERRLLGKIDFQAASSLFHFNKAGRVQRLIHSLKYHGSEDVAAWLGKELAKSLKKSERFPNDLIIVPVPLHPKKEKQRGFNQSERLAEAMIGEGFTLSSSALFRSRYSDSQTHKSNMQRWANVSGIFALHDEHGLEGQNVLLLDDVLTTGATIEACATTLSWVKGIKLYIAVVACAEI